MPSYWTRKKIYTHTSNLRALNERKTTHKEGNKDKLTKRKKKQHKIDKKPEHREICMYVLRGTVRTAKKSKEPKTNTRP